LGKERKRERESIINEAIITTSKATAHCIFFLLAEAVFLHEANIGFSAAATMQRKNSSLDHIKGA
jgi:hypothetical protein